MAASFSSAEAINRTAYPLEEVIYTPVEAEKVAPKVGDVVFQSLSAVQNLIAEQE